MVLAAGQCNIIDYGFRFDYDSNEKSTEINPWIFYALYFSFTKALF